MTINVYGYRKIWGFFVITIMHFREIHRDTLPYITVNCK